MKNAYEYNFRYKQKVLCTFSMVIKSNQLHKLYLFAILPDFANLIWHLSQHTGNICVWVCVCVCVCIMKVFQSCSALCDPMDHSMPGSSVHKIFQARILNWVASPFCRESTWPRDQTQVSCIAGKFFTIWASRDAHMYNSEINYLYVCLLR